MKVKKQQIGHYVAIVDVLKKGYIPKKDKMKVTKEQVGHSVAVIDVLAIAKVLNETIHEDYERYCEMEGWKEEKVVRQVSCGRKTSKMLCDICLNEEILEPIEKALGLESGSPEWLEFRKVVYKDVRHCIQSMGFDPYNE